MPHTLPSLPYDFGALEPHIDAKTMEIHHGKHHQTYVTKLNEALEKAPELANKSLDELMQNVDKAPDAVKAAIRNNGGGHWNHSFFWQLMGPNAGGEPTGAVADAISASFGDFAKFKEQFGA
ncbi:MAG TPA: superoxide dismutase, partial [Gemmatimonadaceae bacterium]|nr:superoxide dismutase [Gemmatimonadaceae bacterium]